MNDKQLIKILMLFLLISTFCIPNFVFGDSRKIMKFKSTDNITMIKKKIRHNNFQFSVKENWVFNMSPEDKQRFYGRHPSNQIKLRTQNKGLGPVAKYLDHELPESFDLRSINQKTYIGPIRNQDFCGSCYSFAAIAAAEAVYNLKNNKFDSNCSDFSEAYLAFCLSDFFSGFDGCGGADYNYDELEALTLHGVINESDFPYDSLNNSCQLNVSDTVPQTIFDSWNRIPCNDIDAIKAAIMIYGGVVAAVEVIPAFEAYDSGIYEDSYKECDDTDSDCFNTYTNHSVSLVGWNDNGDIEKDGYWILRNSWGEEWGENGYMKIQYNSAAVACAVAYLAYESQVPKVITKKADNITCHSADLTGIIYPNGNDINYYFEYGETENYGEQTELFEITSSSDSIPVTIRVNNLRPKTTYHFRLVAHIKDDSKILNSNEKIFDTFQPDIKINKTDSFDISSTSGKTVSQSFVISNSSNSCGELEYSIKLENNGSYHINKSRYKKILRSVDLVNVQPEVIKSKKMRSMNTSNMNLSKSSKIKLSDAAFTKMSSSFASSIHIAILGTDNINFLLDLQNSLLETGYFASVTVIDISFFTPNYSELQLFQSVLLFTTYQYADPVMLGNALADYVDHKGGVVSMLFEVSSFEPEKYSVQGRWKDDNYCVIPRGIIKLNKSSLGEIHNQSHFIMNNVKNFIGGEYSFRPDSLQLSENSERIADWKDGAPLIASKVINGSRIVDLGFYPNSENGENWDPESDGIDIIANSLYWVSNDTPWITIENASGTITNGQSENITISCHSTTNIPTDYKANIIIRHNANNMENPVVIPVNFYSNPIKPPELVTYTDKIRALVRKGKTVTKKMKIENLGDQSLKWSMSTFCGSSKYKWGDSDSDNDIKFKWIDISKTGNNVDKLSDDNVIGPYSIGFQFPYFDKKYQTFYISSNGYITIGDSTNKTKWTNRKIPDSDTPNNMVAWFWDDLRPGKNTQVYYQTIENKLIIQFNHFERYADKGDITAEIILHSDGSILMQYKRIDEVKINSCSIGIENEDGTNGLGVLFNKKYLHENLAIKIFKANSCSWLSGTPMTGKLEKNKSNTISIKINATNLDEGEYEGRLEIQSNDPEKKFVVIPVTISVSSAETSKMECFNNYQCVKGFYCEKKAGECLGMGYCVEKPSICYFNYLPVCGCDMFTYPNACSAASQGASILHGGRCEDFYINNFSTSKKFEAKKPTISFDYTPSYNNRLKNLKGRVENVTWKNYGVAVFIYVNGWYNKPYNNKPLTQINNNGKWVCDITTKGGDHKAKQIAAFLVPNDYKIPILNGSDILPKELYNYPYTIIER